MQRVLKRKTNDEEVRLGDVIYDREGKRYYLDQVAGERVIKGVHTRFPSRALIGSADGWGLYFDPPYEKDRRLAERDARAYWVNKAREYSDLGDL